MMISRRGFARAVGGGVAWGCGGVGFSAPVSLISKIERSVIWNGRQAGFTWFHPRACRVPDGAGSRLLMAVQTISGSDAFGSVHLSESGDRGRSWSEPGPIPGLERREIADGLEEAVCDTVPQHHPQSGSVLFMGWNVYYRGSVLAMPNERRWPVYVARRSDGSWTPRRKLDWAHPGASQIYGSNCSQRLTLPDGDVLVPVTYTSYGRDDRVVGTLLCSFDGERLRVKKTGNYLELGVKRGLLEPSITFFEGRYLMTIRAEDDRGYVSVSDDGLIWGPMRAWRFDDGEELTMSTTQQHWMEHSDGLHLVYTRKTDENAGVVRWRTPLLAARVDLEHLRLVRETETTVFPMSEEDRRNPAEAALLGNFHVVNASGEESLVTVGENRSRNGFRGDTLQARVIWNRPNRLVA